MAPKQEVDFLDGIVRATFVSRQEAASVLQAQLLLCQLVKHQEDPLSGCFVASHSSSSNLKLLQVAKSSPKSTSAGLLGVEGTLLHCTDGSGNVQTLSLSSAVDLLPPAACEDAAAAEHLSEASWCSAVQQLHTSTAGRDLSTMQQVATVMLKLWRYTRAHQLLLPIQQLLQRHRSSMAALRPIITAPQDFSSGQQLHVKLQQQLHTQQQQTQQQLQRQQRSWAQLLAEPSEALVAQLHNQLPGVPHKALLQLLRLLSAAVSGLEATVTQEVLQQMLHDLEHPGSFQPAAQQEPDNCNQQQAISNNEAAPEQAEQQQQQQQPAQSVTPMAKATSAGVSGKQEQQEAAAADAVQVDGAETGAAALPPWSSTAGMQLPAAHAMKQHVQCQQQQQQLQAAVAQAPAVPPVVVPGAPAGGSQQTEDEQYSPTRHAAEEAATVALAGLGAFKQARAATTQKQQPQGQQHQHQLGAKRAAAGGGEQPRSKKAATSQATVAPRNTPAANGSAASPTAAAAATSAGAAATPAKPSAASGGSKLKLPANYALTLFDDLRFSLQHWGLTKAVVDTRGRRLVQLDWYLKVHEPMQQHLPSEELAVKFLAKYPDVFRLEKRPPAIGSTPATFLGIQPHAAQALLAGKRCQQLLAAYKARLHSHLQQQQHEQQQQQGHSAGGVIDLALASARVQAGGLMDPLLKQYSDKLFTSFKDFAAAALADEFVLVDTGGGRQGLMLRQPAAAEPAGSCSMSVEPGECR
uniref:Uncharacterized protein n=1 Tax=Tetradesmus obliquus TaxID=3088 RepID=A0A383WCZ6_TETOB|eukprot:jgi/Sobl393_1/155/SZX74894.1